MSYVIIPKDGVTDGDTTFAALPTSGIMPGSRALDTSGNSYLYDGDSWVQTGSGGHILVRGGGVFTPSNYAASPVALSLAGDGYIIAPGARYLSIGVSVAVNAGATGIFIAFGTSELDAEANVSGTVGAEVGMMLGKGAAGDVYIVGIPTDPTITHFALAENHASPVGKVCVTQGV